MGVDVNLVVRVDNSIASYCGAVSIDTLIWFQELWQGSNQGDKVLLKVLEDGYEVQVMSGTYASSEIIGCALIASTQYCSSVLSLLKCAQS